MWRTTSCIRGGTPRPSRCSRSRWRSFAACSATITPTPPEATTTWRYNLSAQRKYAQAQPLLEKALEINRRLLGDNHPQTAQSYNNVANNVNSQRKYEQAQQLYEKALEINRRLLADDHPSTAVSYNNLADNLKSQGKYAQAQPLFEKGLEIYRRLLMFEHPKTALSYSNLAANFDAQGKYLEARDNWLSAFQSMDKARLRVAFTGLERAGGTKDSVRPALAAVLARLGQPAEAWQSLEEDLGRGLLDELAARADQRLAPAERARLRELTAALERLDKLVETTPKGLDQSERAKRFEELKRERELASIALGEFQTKLIQESQRAGGPGRQAEAKSRPRFPPMPPSSPGSILHRWDRTRLIPTASTGA